MKTFAAPEAPPWDSRFWQRHPGIETLRPVSGWPAWSQWPDVDDLQAVADANAEPVANESGSPLRLSRAPSVLSATEYETSVAREARLAVRLPGWHDVFNVLAWAAWPKAKAALNARNVAEIDRHAGPNRSRARDALTGFDEDGVVVYVADPRLEQLAREFRWKALFWEHRAALANDFRVYVFGHALAEKLLEPFVGLTAKAVFVESVPGLADHPIDRQRAILDRRLADILSAPDRFATPAELAPLPVLGLPGWWPGGENAAFYDDVAYFRPGRLRRLDST